MGVYVVACGSGVRSQQIGGGHNFARERSDQARRSVATDRREGVGGGCPPPPTLGSFFIFRLENVQSGGAYLRRIFRLDDMYYMGKRVTIRRSGKGYFVHELGNIIMQICTPKIIFAMYYITYNILITYEGGTQT